MNRRLLRIIIAGLLLAVAMMAQHLFAPLSMWHLLAIYAVPYLLVGGDVLAEAVEGLLHGEPFNEHVLMSIATCGALFIGFLPGAEPQCAEAVAVMLFFQIGEMVEHYGEHRSRSSISHLMDLRPDVAHALRNGHTVDVAPDSIAVGEMVVVRAGERVPLDGVVADGTSSLDTSALTGESMPRPVEAGDEVPAGCVNRNGLLHLRVTKPFEQSTAEKIISLVEQSKQHKSSSERFISRFARVYTPAVVVAAVCIAVVPTLLSLSPVSNFATWLYRALTFLVVSCPCALVISVPLAYFGGIGGASRRGILIKGANFIDVLTRVDTVVFDKTGTLTKGSFDVYAVHPDACDADHLLHLAAHVERNSSHPIAAALMAAFPNEHDDCAITDVQEQAGLGVCARVNGEMVAVGNERMMRHQGNVITPCSHNDVGTVVHVAINGVYAGHIVVADTPKADAAEAIDALHRGGVRRTAMLTGDTEQVAAEVAQTLNVDVYHAALLPADKVRQLEQLMGENPRGRYVAFVGDGINDAPVLARADVGIAMGGLGADAAIEAADVVVMDDKPSKVALAIDLARRTDGIARQNVVFAIGVKLAVLLLAAMGVAGMWAAVFADVGVTLLAVLNSLRTLRS